MRSFLLPSLVLFLVACKNNVDQVPVSAADRALQQLVERSDLVLSDADHHFTLRAVQLDVDGTEHVRFDRTYRGMNVLGGDVVVHSDASGQLLGVTTTLHSPIQLDSNPSIPQRDAIVIGADEQSGMLTAEPTAELVVYARGEVPLLAYDVLVQGVQEDQTPSSLHVIVDAQHGDVLDRWDMVHTGASVGSGTGFFSGAVTLTTDSISSGYELRDPSRGNLYTINLKLRRSGGSVFSDVDNTWGNGTLKDHSSVAVDAQYGVASTWDYFLDNFGRNGIADDGVGAYNRVHYGHFYSNAFWDDSCFCMTYGDGDGRVFNPFDSLDVAGHEMSHGVTSRTANLYYSGESGGLNEATSDIFGSMVEYYANNAEDAGDYQIGEKLYRSGKKALRYMYDPDIDGYSKGCYTKRVGQLDVHYSSGVANHFFYLLAEGSASALTNTCDTGQVVTGIGREAAEQIWYRALTVYMNSNTDYAGARTATLDAASDLYGSGSAEYTAVEDAWAAVQVQ